MKVILLQDVKNVGTKGQVVEVSEGYGRNFILRRKLGEVANNRNLNEATQAINAKKHKEAQEKDEATVLASQIEKVTVELKVRVGSNGKLFGAIKSKDVAEALIKQTGIEDVDRQKISLVEKVKGVGLYKATAKLHKDISADFLVKVTEG